MANDRFSYNDAEVGDLVAFRVPDRLSPMLEDYDADEIVGLLGIYVKVSPNYRKFEVLIGERIYLMYAEEFFKYRGYFDRFPENPVNFNNF